MQKTNIEWTSYTTNPLKYRRKSDGKVVWGCVKTSPGCSFCYSETIALRFDRGRLFNAKNMEELEPFLDDDELRTMLTYKPASGKRCFAFDMTDLFGEWVSEATIDRVFATFALRQDVTWQILTKRAGRLPWYFKTKGREQRVKGVAWEMLGKLPNFDHGDIINRPWPLPNVWLGASVENQKYADERIPHLLATPAAVRFVSYEPALEAVDWSPWVYSDYDRYCRDDRFGVPKDASRTKLDWIIAGGESGHGARSCDIDWFHSTVQQCKAAGVACFIKQMGGRPYEMAYKGNGRVYTREAFEAKGDVHDEMVDELGKILGSARLLNLNDKKGGDWSEWPEDLRVREFPKVKA